MPAWRPSFAVRYTRPFIAMDETFQAILDSLPPKPPRSRLEPYRELIREMRRRGRTYREIAQVLAEKCQVRVAPSTVHDFVRIRSRRSKGRPTVLPEPIGGELVAPEEPTEAAAKKPPERSAQEQDEIRRRIASLKQRPKPAMQKPVFEYDDQEPLRLLPQPPTKNE